MKNIDKRKEYQRYIDLVEKRMMEENKEKEYKKYVDLMEARVKGNKTTGKSVKYLEKLCAEMKKLNRMIGQCYIKNEEQQYPMIGQKQMDAIKKSYETCIRYASLARNKDSRTDILNGVYMVLLNDLRTINLLKETDVFAEKFRKEILHFEDLNIKTVGGALSERIPICYKDDRGTLHRGFFTKERSYQRRNFYDVRSRLSVETDKKAGYGPVIQRLVQSKSFLDFMKGKSADALDKWFYGKLKALTNKKEYSEENDREIYSRFWKKLLSENGQSTEDIAALPDDADGVDRTIDMIQFLVTYFSKSAKENFEMKEIPEQFLYEKHAGISNGDNLTDRNCAMSQIAQLLGREELLARSVPMQIRVGKESMQGVFMEEAKGVNIEAWEKKRKQLKMDQMNPSALKDIADIQIIDYICGNVDRHTGNMIYQFDENGNLNHIIGIDHDLSMGGKNNIGGTLKLPKLNNMLVISEPMAERVMGMKEEQLMLMLGGLDISENQKKAAWERVREVKDKIKAARMITEEDFSQKLKDYEFYIVPDDKWEKLKVEKNLIPEIIKWGQGEKNQKKNKYILTYNLYSRLYNNKACIEAENKMQGSQEQKEKILTFKEGTYESPSFSEYGIEKNKEEIDRIAEQMKNMFGKEGLENRGREFQDMYKNVQTLQTWFKEHGNFENITREDKQALRNAYAQTQESCQAYIRKHNPWTKIGKDRQNAATELMEFIGAQGIAIDGYFALQENTREIILKNEERINEFLKLANTLKEGLKTGSAEEKKACQEAVDAQKTLYIMSTKKALSPENQKEAVGWMKKLIAYDEIKRYVDRENWQKQLKNKNHTPQGLRQFLQEESVLREQARGQKQLEKQEKKVSVKDNGQICQKL